jgi:hypothetical protein
MAAPTKSGRSRTKRKSAAARGQEASKTIKRSVTIRLDLDEEAHEIVGERGFSALVNDGLERAIQARRITSLIEEYEAAHGVISVAEGEAALAEALGRGRRR